MCQHSIFRFCGLAAAGLFALSNGAKAQAEQKFAASGKSLIHYRASRSRRLIGS